MKFRFDRLLAPQIVFAAGLLSPFLASTAAGFGTAPWRDWQVIWAEHTDIRVGYTPAGNQWHLGVKHDFSDRTPRDATIFWIKPDAKRTLPEGRPASMEFLGEPGETYYWIPSTPQDFEVVDLGFSAEDVALNFFAGSFGGNVSVELTHFSGPGDLSIYGFRSGGILDLHIDTRREAPYGHVVLRAGGHSHFNWAFKERGIHILHFRAHGTRADGSGETSSESSPFIFLAEPHPAHWWQLDQFRLLANEAEAQLANDASGDGHPNLLAYAFGYSPFSPASAYLPAPETVERDGQSFLSLIVRRPAGTAGRDDRSDLTYRVQVSGDLALWTDLTVTPEAITADLDGTPRIRFADTVPIEEAPRRFIRVVVEHNAP